MKLLISTSFFFGIIMICATCKKKDVRVELAWQNKFQDTTIRKIYNSKDQRNSASLIGFFNNQDSNYRAEAIMAFASIQDTLQITSLAELLLEDKVVKVRKAAAFALGQIQHFSAIPFLQNALEMENEPEVLSEVLKAIGKCSGDEKILAYLVNKKLELKCCQDALMWGFYYAGLRNNFSSDGDILAITLIEKTNNYSVRLAASSYLARYASKRLNLTESKEFMKVILQVFNKEEEVIIKNNLIKALNGLIYPETLLLLKDLFEEQHYDYRIQVNALKALGNYPYKEVADIFWEQLENPHQAVVITASAFLKENVPKAEIRRLIIAMKTLENTRAKADLLARCKMLDSMKEVDDYLLEQFSAADNPYKIAKLIQAEASGNHAKGLLQKLLLADTAAIIKTTAFESFLTQIDEKAFVNDINANQSLKESFTTTFKNALLSGDVSLVYQGALALRKPKSPLKDFFTDYQFLHESLQKLSLPLKVEAWIELQKTIRFLENDSKPSPPIPQGKTAINWKVLKSIKQKGLVEIVTTKGKITISLFPEDAPGTVAMFVDLIEKDFYNKKYFHRNVPDFVIQGGCPRGDGFGGLDETIRSEFSYLEYLEEGVLGIASAGKDTESCQFFITHTTTPRLNGRYTIFAKVIAGMDVVHQLQVGDQIIDITILNE
ncbi:MAG: peptidylprolyl isomerase [Bacteroidota bacterium]